MNIINSNLQFRSLDYSNKPDTIVLHNADASICSIQDIHAWHLANGWAGCGYHYLVRKDGSIYTGRPENAVGAHCPGQNSHSIGICAEGKYMVEQMPEAQKQAIKELGIYIKKKYGVKTAGGHKEFYSTDCPGTNYPLVEIKSAILNGNAAVVNNVVASAPKQESKATVNIGDINSFSFLQHEFNAQFKVGIAEDNIPGPITISKCPLVKQGSRGNITKWIQNRLNKLGFNCGAADGIFGNMTANAVRAFQGAHGLVADAIIGQNTWRKLLGL